MKNEFCQQPILSCPRSVKADVFSVMLVVLCALFPLSALGKTVTVKFDSTDDFVESCGVRGTATASGFSATEKSNILAKIQSKYDAALGPGKVVVSEGMGGDVDLIVSGGRAPGSRQGKEAGDAGKPGKPAVVHRGEFDALGYTGDVLVCAVGESAAHEIGHKFGLSHNCDTNPPTLMTEGKKVSDAARRADHRGFTSNEIPVLRTNLVATGSTEHKDNYAQTDLGVFMGTSLVPFVNFPDDEFLNVDFTFQGPSGTEFGFMSRDNTFVNVGTVLAAGVPQNGFMTFIYSAGVNLAVRRSGAISSLAQGGTLSFGAANPANARVFQQAGAIFNIQGQTAFWSVSLMEQTTSGFFRVPPPSQITQIRVQGGSVFLTFTTLPGYSYFVEGSNDLRPANWTVVTGNIPGTGSPAQVTLPENFPNTFYRVSFAP